MDIVITVTVCICLRIRSSSITVSCHCQLAVKTNIVGTVLCISVESFYCVNESNVDRFASELLENIEEMFVSH